MAELAALRQRVSELESRHTQRKQPEVELRIFKAIVESSCHAVAISDTRGQLVYINPAHENLFGRSLEETRRVGYRDCYSPESLEVLNSKVVAAMKKGETWEGVLNAVDANGRRFPLWLCADTVRDADEETVYGFCLMHDITEKERTEEALCFREAILGTVSAAAEKFLRATSPKEERILEILAQLGEATKVSRVYIFENHIGEDGTLFTSQRHEWVAPGIRSQADNPDVQNYPWRDAGMARWEETLRRGGFIQGHVREFPLAEQYILAPQEIQSIVAVPIFIGEKWWGFIGFDEYQKERAWSQAEIEALKTASAIIGAFIERTRMEEALREEDSFRTAVIERAAEGLCVCHEIKEYPYVNFTVWNRRMTDITGYTMEKINRLGWYQTVYPDPETQGQARERMKRMRDGHDLHAEEWEITRADGQKRTLSISTSVLRMSDGSNIHVLALMHDVTEHKRTERELSRHRDHLECLVKERTAELGRSNEQLRREIVERRRAEQALRESEAKLNAMLESISDYMSMIDREFNIIWANQTAKGIFGDDIIGKKCHTLYYGSDDPCSTDQCPALETFKDGKVHENERKVTYTNGKNIHFHCMTNVALRDKDGRPTAIMEVYRDITKIKQAEEALRSSEARLQHAQKMDAIGTLAGGIAHDFNNALLGIAGNIELLEMDLPNDESVLKYAKRMKASIQRMAQLTEQLLAYAQGGKYQSRTISLGDFVRDTLPLLQHVIRPSIRVDMDLTTNASYIRADVTQMQMVLAALLSNAAEAIEGEGRIRIVISRREIDEKVAQTDRHLEPGEYICLTVEDDGKGMDEKTKGRLFEPFFTTKFQGRGLGMAAVYGIAKSHRGGIFIDTESGKGTAVHICLPAAKPETQEEKAPQEDSAQSTGTILVIEDDKAVMDVTQAMIESLGYRVLMARTGTEAVEIARTFDGDIDVAVLDIGLPDIEGGEVYRTLMDVRPKLKVIVCSGYAADGPVQKILDKGAQDFVQKPFSLKTLATKLQEVLGKECE